MPTDRTRVPSSSGSPRLDLLEQPTVTVRIAERGGRAVAAAFWGRATCTSLDPGVVEHPADVGEGTTTSSSFMSTISTPLILLLFRRLYGHHGRFRGGPLRSWKGLLGALVCGSGRASAGLLGAEDAERARDHKPDRGKIHDGQTREVLTGACHTPSSGSSCDVTRPGLPNPVVRTSST